MKQSDFTHILPYGKGAYEYWISGIYKIVSYYKGEYLAFYIPDGFDNWGNHTAAPPVNGKHGKCWPSLRAAIESCREHAKSHQPSTHTRQRAQQIKTALILQASAYAGKEAA